MEIDFSPILLCVLVLQGRYWGWLSRAKRGENELNTEKWFVADDSPPWSTVWCQYRIRWNSFILFVVFKLGKNRFFRFGCFGVGYSAIFVRGGFSWYTFCLDVCSSSFGEFKFIVFLFSRSSPVSLVFPPFPKTIKTIATHTSAVCSRDSLLHYYTHTHTNVTSCVATPPGQRNLLPSAPI